MKWTMSMLTFCVHLQQCSLLNWQIKAYFISSRLFLSCFWNQFCSSKKVSQYIKINSLHVECEGVEKARAMLSVSYSGVTVPTAHLLSITGTCSLFSNLSTNSTPGKAMNQPAIMQNKKKKNFKGTLNNGQRRHSELGVEPTLTLPHPISHSQTVWSCSCRLEGRDDHVRGRSERLAPQRDTASCAILLPCILPVKSNTSASPGSGGEVTGGLEVTETIRSMTSNAARQDHLSLKTTVLFLKGLSPCSNNNVVSLCHWRFKTKCKRYAYIGNLHRVYSVTSKQLFGALMNSAWKKKPCV